MRTRKQIELSLWKIMLLLALVAVMLRLFTVNSTAATAETLTSFSIGMEETDDNINNN